MQVVIVAEYNHLVSLRTWGSQVTHPTRIIFLLEISDEKLLGGKITGNLKSDDKEVDGSRTMLFTSFISTRHR